MTDQEIIDNKMARIKERLLFQLNSLVVDIGQASNMALNNDFMELKHKLADLNTGLSYAIEHNKTLYAKTKEFYAKKRKI